MINCIFCKIAKKEVPADIVYEDNDYLAFLDINPINIGHALLIPKKHFENLYEMSDSSLNGIAPLIKKTAIAIKKATKADGINIGMNNESAAGQIVPHAHIHIIPRFSGDGLRHWPGKSFPPDQMTEMAERIKNLIV